MNKSVAVLLLSVAGVTAASAGERFQHFFGFGGHDHEHGSSISPINAPEIDPASAISALTLLAGGVTVLRSRFSKK